MLCRLKEHLLVFHFEVFLAAARLCTSSWRKKLDCGNDDFAFLLLLPPPFLGRLLFQEEVQEDGGWNGL